MEHIKKAIEAFVKGGDTNDSNLLDKVVHPQFQNIQDGFFEEKGIYIFSKSEYLELVAKKTFGGSPRAIRYESVEQSGNIAIVKVELESEYLLFSSTIICVRVEDKWEVINNIPIVEVKQTVSKD